MLALASAGRQVDFENIVLRLQENEELESSGGMDYISELVDGAVSGAVAGRYIETIQAKAQLRRLISTADRISEEASGSSLELDSILDDAERSIMDVTRRRRGSDFRSSAEICEEVKMKFPFCANRAASAASGPGIPISTG
ncbi:DnaB-like helicase N-terminal domain-containing protein [Allobaculum sp. Allo2]|uniref:DnaB-like helicase N-terminal domain-containing protein n=1 Tax=Allobaculum sp. Allo2 TaxID=2853432 RepID=UPI003461D642